MKEANFHLFSKENWRENIHEYVYLYIFIMTMLIYKHSLQNNCQDGNACQLGLLKILKW